MTDKTAIQLICIFASFCFIVFLSPKLRFDSLKYLEVPRSIVFDSDLNVYNEEAYFTNPGWSDVTRRKLFQKQSEILKFMNHPEFTKEFYKFVFFPVGSAIIWLPPMYFFNKTFPLINTFFPSLVNNGYSAPYRLGFALWNYFLFLIALLVSYRILRFFFNEVRSVILIISVVLGSNILPFVFIDICFTHSIDFFLVTLIVYMILKFDDTRKLDMFNLGMVIGLSAIIRYQDIAFIIVPVIYLFRKWFFKKEPFPGFKLIIQTHILFVIGFLFSVCLQSLFWKIIFGNWIVTSTTMGISGIPTFNLFHLQLMDVFLSKFHGLFAWMPLLIPAFGGILLFPLKISKKGFPLLAVFFIEVYYNASRTEWWNLGFGVRRYSGFIIFFMLGLGFTLSIIRKKSVFLISCILIAVLCFWNIIFLTTYYSEYRNPKLISELVGELKPYTEHEKGLVIPDPVKLKHFMIHFIRWIEHDNYFSHVFKREPIKTWLFIELLVICILLLVSILIGKLVIKSEIKQLIRFLTFSIFLGIALSYILLIFMYFNTKTIYFIEKQDDKIILVPLKINKSSIFYGKNELIESDSNTFRIINTKSGSHLKMLFRINFKEHFQKLPMLLKNFDPMFSIRELSRMESEIFYNFHQPIRYSYYLFEANLHQKEKLFKYIMEIAKNWEIISIWIET